MKTNKVILFLMITGLLITPLCKPDKKMLVETGDVSNVLTTTANVSGTVIDVGEGATQYGHCYGTATGPSITGTKTALGIAVKGDFTSNLTELEPSTTYYVRAYCSLGGETAYGSEISFTTASAALAELTTTAITSITKSSVVTGGNITSEGGTPVTAKGVCWNVASGPTTANSKTIDGSGSGNFASSITGLSANTKYYVRAYATNSGGTAYGNEMSFTSSPEVTVAPAVSTVEVTSVTANSAVSGGDVTSEGGAAVTAKGVCWSTSANPTITNSKTTDGTGTGSFASNLTGLLPGTTYYVRAYATNSAGTSYGTEYSFKTSVVVPTLTTIEISSVTSTTATSGGNITSDGGSAVTARGVCWKTSANPTTSDSKTTDGLGSGLYSSSLTGLTGNTTYYVRAYATNIAGTAYGNELSFKAGVVVPLLTTTAVTSITSTTAASGGDISSDGGSSVTAKGVCWSTSANPTTANTKTSDGSGIESFTSSIIGLAPGTTYHVRAYATNSTGTGYGEDVSFTTSVGIPTVTTSAISNITSTAATSGGNVTSEGGAAVTVRGACWITSTGPTVSDFTTSNGSGSGIFESSITGLTASTKYYVRAYATNSEGTAYGNELSFTTNAAASIPPTAAIAAATSVTNTTATLNGAVNANGNSSTAIFEYGPTTLYGSTATAIQSPVTGDTPTTISASLTALTPGTLYHFRVKAVNIGGTHYSDDMTFTTLQIPLAATEAATLITTTTATLNATVNAINLSTNVTFEYGLNISYGSTAVGVPNPITGINATSVTAAITVLTPGTIYHFRVKAVSSGGTTYGDDQSFTTLCNGPSATTGSATITGSSSCTLNGTVNANDFSTDVIFEYGTTLSYGSTIAAVPGIVTGNTNTPVSSSVTELTPGELYHFRVKATNCGGTIYGDDQTFMGLTEALISDMLLLCYSELHEYIEFTFLFDAVYSNNIPSPNSAWTAIHDHTQNANNEKILMLWSKAYDIIYKTNFIIINSSVISDGTTRDKIIAQAKAIRAYLYYNLLIWFGEVPLETGTTESMNARNTVSEVLAMINQGASDALQSLPWGWSAPDKFRINHSFAQSIIARTSLYVATYSPAVTSAEDVINSGLYALSADTNNFTSTNVEIYWGFDKSTATEFSVFFTKGIYVPAFRYTESYLVMTEAYKNLGNTAGALNYINALIIRRGLPPLSSLTNDDIYQQWKIELIKEGSMFITLKRFNKATSVLGIEAYKLVLPIPQSILNKNPNLIQNPGY